MFEYASVDMFSVHIAKTCIGAYYFETKSHPIDYIGEERYFLPTILEIFVSTRQHSTTECPTTR